MGTGEGGGEINLLCALLFCLLLVNLLSLCYQDTLVRFIDLCYRFVIDDL